MFEDAGTPEPGVPQPSANSGAWDSSCLLPAVEDVGVVLTQSLGTALRGPKRQGRDDSGRAVTDVRKPLLVSDKTRSTCPAV